MLTVKRKKHKCAKKPSFLAKLSFWSVLFDLFFFPFMISQKLGDIT